MLHASHLLKVQSCVSAVDLFLHMLDVCFSITHTENDTERLPGVPVGLCKWHMKEVHGVTDREERRLMLGMASGRYGGPLCCPEMRCRGREFTRLDCHLNTVHKMAKDKRTEVLMKQRRAAIFSRLNQIKKKRKEVEVIQQSLMCTGQGVDNLHKAGKKRDASIEKAWQPMVWRKRRQVLLCVVKLSLTGQRQLSGGSRAWDVSTGTKPE
ncbi:uncharacterized protein LOC123965111 [Micropterus dolomieu]|uniref:uncharacterized protein LOC123965111 n=1 Tax=Micropterus dolomieu TaxID=147949 RepID=UPI001E8E3364|nr:uncharacterized protein LOC123965111 [Micropterus dolomieu]